MARMPCLMADGLIYQVLNYGNNRAADHSCRNASSPFCQMRIIYPFYPDLRETLDSQQGGARRRRPRWKC